MPTNTSILPLSAAGWTTSNNALLDDGVNTTASTSRIWDGFSYVETPSPTLTVGTFTGLYAGLRGQDKITSITVEVQAGWLTTSAEKLNVYPATGGSLLSGAHSEELTLSGSAGVNTLTTGNLLDAAGSVLPWQIDPAHGIVGASGFQVQAIGHKYASSGTADLALDVVKVTLAYTLIDPVLSGSWGSVTGVEKTSWNVSPARVVSGLGAESALLYVKNNSAYYNAYVSVNGGAWQGRAPGAGSNITIVDGDSIVVGMYSNPLYSSSCTMDMTYPWFYPAPAVTDTFTVTTRAQDTSLNPTPNFGSVTGAHPSAYQATNVVYIGGIDSDYHPTWSALSVGINPQVYRSGAWYVVGLPYTLNLGDYLFFMCQASATAGATVTATATIDGVGYTFPVTTLSDPYCDDFSFTPSTGNAPSSTCYSNAVTINGMLGSQSIYLYGWGFITSSFCRKNGGAWTALPVSDTTVQGDTWEFKIVSGAGGTDAGGASMYVTGASGTGGSWIVANGAADMIPNAFTWTDKTNAVPGTTYESNTIMIGGLTGGYSTPISFPAATKGAEISINGAAWTTAVTGNYLFNGDTVKVRAAAYTTPGRRKDILVNIGSVTDTFSITTRSNPPPQDF